MVWFYGRGHGTRENSTNSVNRSQPVLHNHCCLKGSLEVPSSEPLSLAPCVGEKAQFLS